MSDHDRIDIRAVFCCCFLLLASIQAGEFKITTVLDANLFVLETGQKIRLAYVEAPSIADSLKNMARLAAKVKNYAERRFLNQKVRVEFLHQSPGGEEPAPVMIYQKFFLKTICYNRVYLGQGFGKFREEHDSSYAANYRILAQLARRKKKGIWDERVSGPYRPTRYVGSAFAGAGSYDKPDGKYRRVMVSMEPYHDANGFKLSGGLILLPNDDRDNDNLLWLNTGLVINGKHFGIEPELFFFRVTDEEFDGMLFDFFIVPQMKFKFGQLNRFYFSLDFFSAGFPFASLSVGATIVHPAPYRKLSLNFGIASESRQMFVFNSQWQLHRRWMLNLQGNLYSNRKEKWTIFGLRVGAGYIFGKTNQSEE